MGSGGEHRLSRAALLHEQRLDGDPGEEERQEEEQQQQEEEGGGRRLRVPGQSSVRGHGAHKRFLQASVHLLFTTKGQSLLLSSFFFKPVFLS